MNAILGVAEVLNRKQKDTNMKTRTCKRCSGSGFRSTPVLHLGVPGLCYGCNGSGVQSWVDAATVTLERQQAQDRHIAEVKKAIEDCELALTMTHRLRSSVRMFEQELARRTEQLATMAIVAEQATKGEWRPSARQAERVGA